MPRVFQGRLRPGLAWVFAAAAAWMLPAPMAQAQSPMQQFNKAVKLYDKLQFPKALQVLQRLARSKKLSRKQRARVLMYQGFCLFYVFTPMVARRKLRQALKLDRKLQIPVQTPPPLRRLVALERAILGIKAPPPPARRRKSAPPRLEIKAQKPLRVGRPITFEGTCSQLPLSERLYVLLRKRGETRYRIYPLKTRGTRCWGQAPNPYPATVKNASPQIEYVFQLRRGQKILHTSPPLFRPRFANLLTTRPTPAKKSYTGLIVGVIVGALAAGGGVALAIILINQPSGPSVRVRIDTASGD